MVFKLHALKFSFFSPENSKNFNNTYLHWQAKLEAVHPLYSTLFNYLHYWKEMQLYKTAEQVAKIEVKYSLRSWKDSFRVNFFTSAITDSVDGGGGGIRCLYIPLLLPIPYHLQALFLRQTPTSNIIELFYMTSRQPYWYSKTMKLRACWCCKSILWELNSFRVRNCAFLVANATKNLVLATRIS